MRYDTFHHKYVKLESFHLLSLFQKMVSQAGDKNRRIREKVVRSRVTICEQSFRHRHYDKSPFLSR